LANSGCERSEAVDRRGPFGSVDNPKPVTTTTSAPLCTISSATKRMSGLPPMLARSLLSAPNRCEAPAAKRRESRRQFQMALSRQSPIQQGRKGSRKAVPASIGSPAASPATTTRSGQAPRSSGSSNGSLDTMAPGQWASTPGSSGCSAPTASRRPRTGQTEDFLDQVLFVGRDDMGRAGATPIALDPQELEEAGPYGLGPPTGSKTTRAPLPWRSSWGRRCPTASSASTGP
jgi:hypothetical protein